MDAKLIFQSWGNWSWKSGLGPLQRSDLPGGYIPSFAACCGQTTQGDFKSGLAVGSGHLTDRKYQTEFTKELPAHTIKFDQLENTVL